MSKALSETVTLSNGEKMPTISLGCYFGAEEDIARDRLSIIEIIKTAIDVGYRHIDTAWIYGTEELVREAIKAKIEDGTVTRQDMFVTTKLSFADHEPSRVEGALRASLEMLGLDYVDLYLLHGPFAVKPTGSPKAVLDENTKLNQENDHIATWKAMEACVKLGLCKSIGVSNFNSSQVQNVLDNCEIKPVNNQVESHPYLTQQKLVDYCLSRGVTVTAYTPLGQAHSSWMKEGFVPPLQDGTLRAIATAHSRNAGQVALRYQIQRGVCVTVKSSSRERLSSNKQIYDFILTDEEMAKIGALNKNDRINLFPPVKDHKDYPFNVEY